MSLTATGIRHQYTPVDPIVLDGLDLSINSGESVALMGPSGSGKSTLLAILGGLTNPTDGSVEIDGSDPVAATREGWISWVFQANNALGRRTALDNVTLPLLVLGEERTHAETKATRTLEAVGLASKTSSIARSLSGGELQRVCIARALVTEPRFVLADEPTGQLDAATSQQVLDALWKARADATALVIATHDSIVAARCERVLSLREGRFAP